MARRLVTLILISVSLTSCMEMKETVERMVMVRTTGSDLQPAATGFIYKRNSDGPTKVIKMGQEEIMEQLKKLPASIYNNYEEPKAFAAPLPSAAGPFYNKEADESRAASHASEAYVIPVEEKVDEGEEKGGEGEEKGDGIIDGIANEDYAKILGEYAAEHRDYKNDFSDYLHGFGDYKEHKDEANTKDNSDGDEGNKGYASSNQYRKGGVGDYHTEKHESFSVSAKSGDDTNGDLKKGTDEGLAKSEKAGGFRELHEKDELKEDGDFYGEESLPKGFGEVALGHGYYGSDSRGYQAGHSHDGGFEEVGFGDGYLEHQPQEYDFADGDDHAKYHGFGDFGDKRGYFDGKSYGFKVEHRR